MTTRTAFIPTAGTLNHGDASELLGRVLAYLPDNYHAALVTTNNLSFRVKIWGEDNHGWTLDGYVIPRLASGNMFAKEEVAS